MIKFKVSTVAAFGLMTVAMATVSCAKSELKGAKSSAPAPKPSVAAADAAIEDQPQPKVDPAKTNPSRDTAAETSTTASVPAAGMPVGVSPALNKVVSSGLVVGTAATVIDSTLNSEADTIKKCLNLWKNGHPFKVVNQSNYEYIDVKVAADVGSIANTLFSSVLGGVQIASTSVGGLDDQNVTAVDKLIVVGLALNYGSVDWKMMNPKGWYCVKGAVAGSETAAKVIIKKHCTAQLASSDLNFAFDTSTQKLAINDPTSGGQIGFAFNSKFEVQPMLNLSGTPCK